MSAQLPPGFELIEGEDTAPARGFLPFLNRGIAGVLDAPFSVSSAVGGGLAGLFGYDSPSIPMPAASGMQAAGVKLPAEGQASTTYPERIGEGIGMAAGSLIPGAGIIGAAQRFGGPLTQGVAGQIARPFVRTPLRAMGVEAAASAGAGAGGLAAERATQDQTGLARTAGEIAGGVAGAMAPGVAMYAAPITSAIARAGRAALVPFTETGARVRASDRLRSLAANPEAAARAAGSETIGGLTPAQRTGEPGLLALERAVMETDAELSQQYRQRTQGSVNALRDAIAAPAEGATPADAQRFFQDARQHLTGFLETRIQQAEDMVRQRMSELQPQMRETQAGIILREELDNAFRAARDQERELWARVPDGEKVALGNTNAAYQRMVERFGEVGADNMPDVARRFLGRDSNQRLGDSTTLKEAKNLYSEMREIERQNRAPNGNRRTAAAAGEIADGILRDYDVLGETNRDIAVARRFSRDMNERFRQGEVGRVLSRSSSGADRVAPEQTAEVLLGRGGARGAVTADELRGAVGDIGDARFAAEDYLRRRFADAVGPEFRKPQAEAFLRQNAEILDRFPELKRNLTEQTQAMSNAQAEAAAARDELGIVRRGGAPADALADAPMGRELDAILRSQDPAAAARALVQEAAGDQTGNAVRGLKAAVVDQLADIPNIGRKLADQRFMAAAGQILSPEELSRARQIADEFAKLEPGRLPDVGGVMTDGVNSIISFIGRTFAARQGARAGQGTSGASLLTANFASRSMQKLLSSLTNDRAERMIRDAMQDPELFADLMRRGDSPQAVQQIETRMTGWLAAQTAREAAQPVEGSEPEGFDALPEGFEIEPMDLPEGFELIEGALSDRQFAEAEGEPQQVQRVVDTSRAANRPVAPITLARAFVGATESRDAGVLSAFFRKMTGDRIDPQETPWCAAFANAVLKAAGIEGTGRLNARSFLDFGRSVERPTTGDVVVLWRDNPDSWKGHVGFFAGYENRNGRQYVRIVGGNQNNSVSEKAYPANQVLGFRRPPSLNEV